MSYRFLSLLISSLLIGFAVSCSRSSEPVQTAPTVTGIADTGATPKNSDSESSVDAPTGPSVNGTVDPGPTPQNSGSESSEDLLTGPQISGVTDTGPIPRYDKFEITFDVALDPSNPNVNPQLPYDPDPPQGLEPSNPLHNGITVDAVFTSPSGETYQQPAFVYQQYDDNFGIPKEHWSYSSSPQEWYYPVGEQVWKARFAPHEPGNWSYYLTATDASGSTQSMLRFFIVEESNNKGFIRVSPTDPRYFEYDSGETFVSLGGNFGLNLDRPIIANKPLFDSLQQNNVKLIRQWFSGFPGAAWPSWAILGGDAPAYLGYLPRVAILPTDAVGDIPVMTWWLDYESGNIGWFGACVFKVYEDSEAVKNDTYYKLQVIYAANHIHQAPRIPGQPHGVVAKISEEWLDNCAEPAGLDLKVTDYGLNTGGQWETLEGVWNSGDHNFLPRVYVALENVQSAENADGSGSAHDGNLGPRANANILSVSLKECLDGAECSDSFGPEIISEYSMQYGLYFADMAAQAMDEVVKLAEEHGIAIKLVLLDKNDNLYSKIDDDGSFVLDGESDNSADSGQAGVYGCSTSDSGAEVCPQNARTLNKIRWLQEAYYRYVQARWGYSTAIHSWEFTNEGDPYSKEHWETTDELGKAMHCRVFGVEVDRVDGAECALNHPNAHLVTTSFWHDFPGYLSDNDNGFWGSPHYPNIDYADGHAYITTSPASLEDKRLFEADAAHYHLWHTGEWGGWNLPYPVMRGEAGMTPADGSTDDMYGLGIQNDLQGIWFHNYVWAGLHPGALYEVYWYYQEHILNNDPASDQYDHQYHHKRFKDFMQGIPLSNGHYQELAADAPNADLRVVGQKDVINGRAHAWIQNRNHTWRNVLNDVSISPVLDTVSIPGFVPNTSYAVEWWNTYTGEIDSTQDVLSNQEGVLQLEVNDLRDDVAVKIGDYTPIDPHLP